MADGGYLGNPDVIIPCRNPREGQPPLPQWKQDSNQRVKAVGDEVIDHTTTVVTATTTQVDVVLNLAPIEPAQLAALLNLVRAGGVLVNTTV